MERGMVFKCNRSQAVRLPKALALPESVKQVDFIPIGRGASSYRPVTPGILGSLEMGLATTS